MLKESSPPGEDRFDSGYNAVGPAYFQTMGIPLLSGRAFTERDSEGAPLVAVVNETVARTVWPGEDPIGKVIVRGSLQFTVVGLARDAKYYTLGEEPRSQIYFPELQVYQARVNVIAQALGNPASLIRPMQQEIRALDPNLAIANTRTLEDVFADSVGRYRVIATLVSAFGLLALVLASVGLYGVLSNLVVQRTRELGIRVALGARGAQVAGTVLAQGLKLALVGIALGITAAWLASQLVSGFLFGVSPRDPVTFILVPVVLTAVAGLASFLPARRAAGVDPMVALRYE